MRFRNGRLVWLTMASMSLAVGALLFLLFPHLSHRINQAGERAIEQGMTRLQVYEVLGVSPGNYAKDQRVFNLGGGHHANAMMYLGWTYEDWFSDEGGISVAFDRQGRVCWKGFTPSFMLPPQTLWGQVHDWLCGRFCKQ